MTTSVGPKGGRLGRRRDPRQPPATTPPPAPSEGHHDPAVWALRAKLAADQLYLRYRDEGRALGVSLVTAGLATSAGKRIERATKKLYELGARDVPASVLQRSAHPGLRAALRALAQNDKYELADGREPSPQATLGLLHDAVMTAEQAIDDYSITCPTAQGWAMSYGLWSARLAQAQGKALALSPDTRTISRREPSEKGKAAITITASVWKDTTGIAATCAARAEYALVMMFKCEDRYREEERRRMQARRIQVIKAQATKPTLEQKTTSTVTVEAVLEKDDAERGDSHGPRSGEEHGAAPGTTPEPFSGAADDLSPASPAEGAHDASSSDGEPSAEEQEEPTDAALAAFVADQVWCSVRNRMVWGALAGTPLPSGPGYAERRAEEARAIADWDRRMASARHALRTRRNGR